MTTRESGIWGIGGQEKVCPGGSDRMSDGEVKRFWLEH